MLENEAWVEQHFGTCDLGDVRRTRRLQTVACGALDSPDQSIPTQQKSWAEWYLTSKVQNGYNKFIYEPSVSGSADFATITCRKGNYSYTTVFDFQELEFFFVESSDHCCILTILTALLDLGRSLLQTLV